MSTPQESREIDKIDVRLSYRIVRLFSEGLYASPNKAIEELVANSFDAGARKVAVFLPTDFQSQTAEIAVLDDGEGMDADGLKQHWLIGKSFKRALERLPRDRQQIGRFGIGKLATYVLANRLTHYSKKNGKYYSTSMNFKEVDDRGEEEVEPKSPIRLSLRELTESQTREELRNWLDAESFKSSNLTLFGKGAASSWTLVVLSSLKPKVTEIRRGRLEWVLRTALPIRDDFYIHLDGKKLESPKKEKGRINKWVLGKDITELGRPAPDDLDVNENKQLPAETRYSLESPVLGRITGYAEAYKDLLTGKSDDISRSHGFFVYVRGRLINVEDGHFGISPDELRHGTFGRIRVVVNMDGLDDHLQSDRERVREGPVLITAQNILRAIFNKIRTEIVKSDEAEDPGAGLVRRLSDSPASLVRRPIIETSRAALEGKIKPRYILLPHTTNKNEQESLIQRLEARAGAPESFVGGLEYIHDASASDTLVRYDVDSGKLRINTLHPYVGAFFDELTHKTSGLPIEAFLMAEVLLESQLYQAGLKQGDIDTIMDNRDQLLRLLAQNSGKRSAFTVATALQNARNDEDKLEEELVHAFLSLGFDATKIGGKGKPDGVAKAHLGAANGVVRKYAVTLEAKSKQKDSARLKTKNFGVSTIVRQRDDYNCEHAIVVAPAFDHTPGKESALAKEIKADRELTKKAGEPKTITAITIDDLARLVRLGPVKLIGLDKMKELFEQCSLPEDCKRWIDEQEKTKIEPPRYEQILKAIHQNQQEFNQSAVEYGALRVTLSRDTPPYKFEGNEPLVQLCRTMQLIIGGHGIISASDTHVEITTSPANVLAAIKTSIANQ